ncbi:hypothetical protein D9Q98_000071 [Chlorella vulgaris]|uniref:cyclin-dependent kinase n=1 Tax=Chlorella vulgaris TaxID=3077 RepID=A0A9D4Z177_CHLVU|nr:hypothetical protein D9Q98_000071 [Chlorella vulgaris]
MLPAPQDANHTSGSSKALLAFIHALESRCGIFTSAECHCILARFAAAAVAEAVGCGGAATGAKSDVVCGASRLRETLAAFGWDGEAFVQRNGNPLDLPRLAARLKALLFVGLRQQGCGTYSTVFRARSRVSGKSVALKRMKLDGREEGVPTTALREVSMLRQLAECPHIVQLEDVLWDQRSLYLVMEMLSCDLREHLDSDPTARSLPSIKSMMYQTIKGVKHAHAHRVIHRDIKPQNLLLDRRSGCIKVADFGLARTITPPARAYTHEVVTLLYRAPEILLGSPVYSTPVDVWSLGCVLAELATGEPLFLGDSEIGQLLTIFQVLGTPCKDEWPGVDALPDWMEGFPSWRARDLAEVVPQLDELGVDLLRQMLRYDPSSRIRCREALAHPWFDDVSEAEEARGRSVLQMVQDQRRERLERVEAAVAAYSHLTEPEGPSTPSELLSPLCSAQSVVTLPG